MSKKSSKPKKVSSVENEEDGDTVNYYIQHDDERTQIMLTVVTSRSIDQDEYLYCLQTFIEDTINNDIQIMDAKNNVNLNKEIH